MIINFFKRFNIKEMSNLDNKQKRNSFESNISTLRNSLKRNKTKKTPVSTKPTGILYRLDSQNIYLNEANTIKNLFKKKEEEILDDINQEGLGETFEERKKIIFENFIDNDSFIFQFISKTQNNLVEKSNIKTLYFGETAVDIYKIMVSFKETIANYCLVIKLYLMKNKYYRALELYLLMVQKNKQMFEYIYKKIKDQFPKITNFNRIGKFYPSITRKYLEILSFLIKFSYQFKNWKMHNMFVNYYIKTFLIVKETVCTKFGIIAKCGNLDFEMQHIGEYLYSTIFFDLAIFYFQKYHSFSFTLKILRHVLDLYNDSIFNDMIIEEKVLLLRTNYNLGLFYFVDGCNQESIQHLIKAKNILSTIKLLPLKIGFQSLKNDNTFQISKESETISVLSNLLNKNKTSSEIPKIESQSNKSVRKKKKEECRKSNGILLGNQMKSLNLQYENAEEKIFNEIELTLAEINLSNNNFRESMDHINRILMNHNMRKRSGYSRMMFVMTNDVKQEKGKVKEENYCNCRMLNDFEKRKIMFILDKIENKHIHRDKSMDNIYISKNFGCVKSKKIYSSKEMEKIFLFLCGLSQYQLKVLNETQPKRSILRNNLPLLITNQFKDCLTHSQRMDLIQLDSMSLSRYVILKNPNEDIMPENLDYFFMKYNVKEIKLNKKNSVKKENQKNNDINIIMNKTVHQRNKNKFISYIYSQTRDTGKITGEKEKIEFNKMLDDILDDKNREFIQMFRDSIISTLINLDNNEKQLFAKSKTFLKDLVKNMEQSMMIKKK